MNAWRRFGDAFGALQRRERLVVLAGSAAAILLLGYSLLVEPQLARHDELRRALARQQQEREALSAGLAAAERRAREPAERDKAAVEELGRRLASSDGAFRELQSRLVPPQQMAALLESILGGSRGLRILSLTTLPVAAVSAAPPVPGTAKSDVRGEAPDAAGLYRHGVRLRVRGTYADMTECLARLERLSQRMYWGAVSLEVESPPVAVMEVTVYTLSLDKSWLVI